MILVVQAMVVLILQKCRMTSVVTSVTGQLRLFVSCLSKSCGTLSIGCLLRSHGEYVQLYMYGTLIYVFVCAHACMYAFVLQ